jgi:N-acetyl-anhydromuramyl-L-alanine amidase AmpD
MAQKAPFAPPKHWKVRLSPNQSARTQPITAIVLHADASSRVDTTLDWMARKESAVSYHVLIGRTGETFLLVNPDRKAWHAGESALGDEPLCNGYSVGVCLSNRNDGEELHPTMQRGAAADICALLCTHYGIPVDRITTHAIVALPKGRKTDPCTLDLADFREMVAARLVGR